MKPMRQTETIFLEDAATRLPKRATLVTGATVADMVVADSQWKPFLVQAVADALARGVPRYDLPENKHWEWERKARAMTARSVAFAIEADNETQALMIVRTDKPCRVMQQIGEPMVYIDYLATAPWNLPRLILSPRFARCGLNMVETAIQHSTALGFRGRIGLHSLQSAETFYRTRLGMDDLGLDAGYEDLRYFEMTEATAATVVQGRNTV